MPEEQKKTVLIAEDDPDIAITLQVAFQSQGLATIVVPNGKKALEEIEKAKPSLVISDILMPVMNGFKLCESIKNDNKTSKIPVILLTAVYRQEHHIDMGFKYGADAYFSKPFAVERVVEVSLKLIDQFGS